MLLSYHGIVKSFGKRRILDGVDLTLGVGQCQLLCGSNGAGKSTLMRIMSGMEKPEQGTVVVNGRNASWRAAKKALFARTIYLHQRPYLFEGSVRRNLDFPLKGDALLRRARVEEGLAWADLTSLADQDVNQLSGGERQRVALVRAWMRRPEVMLLDEPTANMDTTCRQRTVELLNVLKAEGVSLLVATHDPLHFAGIADAVLDLEGGRLRARESAYDGYTDKVTPFGKLARAAV